MAIPVKMVSIEMNGAVTDVSTFVQCKSANEDIVKVGGASSAPAGGSSTQESQRFALVSTCTSGFEWFNVRMKGCG